MVCSELRDRLRSRGLPEDGAVTIKIKGKSCHGTITWVWPSGTIDVRVGARLYPRDMSSVIARGVSR
jgi:hypothetical protein